MTNTLSPCRRTLRLSTALASVMAVGALAPVAAHAQELPSVANDGGAMISPVVPGTTTTMTVDLQDANRVVTWNSFNIKNGATQVSFRTDDTALNYAVLNRVVTGGPKSEINGLIQSQDNIRVWLINPSGIVFGTNGAFSGGSLVLSTIGIKDGTILTGDDQFLLANNQLAPLNVNLSDPSDAAIVLNSGTSIISSGSVVAIGQQIMANGAITANSGTVALIAGTDVTLPATLGSPLGFTINAGTTLAEAQASVGGDVKGGSVRLVGASQSGAIANLLNVDSGGKLTASAVGGTVVIGTRTAGGVTFDGAIAGTNGITSAGTLTTTGGGASDILLTATGGISQSNAVIAARDFTVNAAGAASVTGAVTAGRNYTGEAASIALGGATALEQKAAGKVEMTSGAGGITGTAGLTLTANSDGTGTEALTLDATGGAINFAAGSKLNGGTSRQSNVGIRLGAAAPLTLGDVAALGLRSVEADHTTFAGDLNPGAGSAPIVLGDVNTVNALNVVSSGALTAGVVNVTGANQGVSLTAATGANDLTLTSATTTNGGIVLSAGRDVSGPSSTGAALTANGTGRDISVTASTGLVRLGAIKAANSITIKAATSITTGTGEATAGDLIYDQTGAGLMSFGNLSAGKSIALRTGAAGGIGASAATVIAGEDIAIGTGSQGINTTLLQAGDDIDLVSGGGVTLGSFAAQGAGAGVDARAVDMSGATIGFLGEAGDHGGSSARLTQTTAPGSILVSGASSASKDIVIDGVAALDLKGLQAGGSIALRSGAGIVGTTMTAGQDIAMRATGGVTATTLRAGDDIDVTAGNTIGLTSFDAQGTDPDTRFVDFSGATIGFTGEAGDHAGSSVRLSNRAGTGAITVGTSGKAAKDILIDTTGLADVAQQTATAGSLGIRAGGAITGTTFTAGEDIAASGGGAVTINRADAGDDLNLTAPGLVTLDRASTTGLGSDARRVDFSGANLGFSTVGVGTGSNISVTSTGSDIIAGTAAGITARDSVLLQSDTGNVRVSGTTGTNNLATINAALDVTGLAGASTGTSDTAFGRADVKAGTNLAVTAGGLAQLGTVDAAVAVAVTGGRAAPASNGAVDVTSATAGTTLSLTARAVTPVGTVYDGDILLGTGSAGSTATLNNVATGGTAGNIAIGNTLSAAGNVTLNSANDVKIKEYVSSAPTTGFIRSTGGSVSVTAAKSVYGIAGTATMVADRGVAGINAGGTLTLNSTGDARFDSLSAGALDINVSGSLTGLGAGGIGTAVTGGAIFATAPGGTVTVNAGAGAADVARLNTVRAGGNININAGNIALGTVASTNGSVILNGSSTLTAGNLYVGSLSVPGNLTITLGGAPAAIADVSTSDIFDPAFGRINLAANAGAISAVVGRVAQLGNVQSTTSTTIAAAGIGATSATTGTSLSLTALNGTLALGTGTAGTSATLTKQSGLPTTAGNDLRVTTLTTNSGDATMLSTTNVRVGTATATSGDVGVSATLGNVNGGPLATDRANLTAASAGFRVLVNANAGTAMLGTVSAGTGPTTTATNQVTVTALGVDATNVTATNGNLVLTANSGDVKLGTGNAKANGTITASQNVRLGSLTAQTGAANVTATAGDLTGAALVTTPVLAGLVSTSGALTTEAGAANVVATLGAVTVKAGNAAQLGTVTAGNGATGSAKALVAANATAGTGALDLTASQGTLALGTGSGATVKLTKQAGAIATVGDDLRVTGSVTSTAGDTAILSNTHARIVTATATGGDLGVTATLGNVNGGPLATDRADLKATSANGRVLVDAAAGTIRLGTVTAGTGVGTSAVDQIVATARGVDVTTATAVNGNLVLTATAGDVSLGTGTAKVDGTVTASQNARIGTLSAQTGNAGATATAGDVTGLALVTTPALAALVSTTGTLTADAGAADINAGGAVTVQAGNAAQLGTIAAGTGAGVNAKAIVVNSATAGTTLGLTATQGTLALNNGSAGTTATLTKQGGAIATLGDELRVTTKVSSGTGTTLQSSTHARVLDATSTGGLTQVTATLGDVTGLARGTAASDTRLLSGFDRANLSATGIGQRVTVSAVAGTAQLGTVTAGSGGPGAVADQLRVDARAIDVANATATNGALTLIATAGDARLATGNAGNGATVTASQSARIGTLTATTGAIGVTATTGDVTGNPTVQNPALGVLVTTGGTLVAQAGAANLTATTGSVGVGAGNAAQLGTVIAGGNIVGTAKALVAGTATAGGSIGLTATQGTLALNTGSAGTTATLTKQGGAIATLGDELRVTTEVSSGTGTILLSNTHARVAKASSTGGDTSVTATLGDVSGLARGAAATDTRLLSDFDRADLGASGTNRRVVVSAVAGTAQLGPVAAGTVGGGAVVDQVRVDARAIDVTTATASNGALTLIATGGDARLVTGTAANGATVTANQSARVGMLTAAAGNIGVSATNGDVTGNPTVKAPAPGVLVTTGNVLVTQAGAAGLTATTGAVTVIAANGAAQLGTVSAGTSVAGTARAVTAATVTSGTTLGLTATQGTLVLGTGNAGTAASLTKQGGSLTTAGDELRVTGALTAGAIDGKAGAATLTSATHIRVPTVEARGGSVTLTAVDGEVTGLAGGRADLTAALARDAGGLGIAGSDRSINVTSGLVSRLGTLTAGDDISVLAGSAGGAARDGSIDAIEATTTRGNLTLDVFNDDAAVGNGIALTRTTATGRNVAGSVALRTAGSNGGAIIVSDTIDAGVDIAANSVGLVNVGTLNAGDDIDLTGNSIAIGTATATGAGADNSAVDFGATPPAFAGTERADRGNANITLTSTGGTVAVSGDLTAQRNVTVQSATAANLVGNVTAGAPLGGVVIAGNYTVDGTNVTLGDAAARTQQASGAVAITATGALTQGAGRLTLNANSDRTGAEALTLSGATGVTLANSALIGGSVAGRESEVRVTSSGGAVALAKVDGQALNIRANSGIGVTEAIDAGNATRAADPVGAGSTVDLATTTGGISLLTATAYGAGHDIVLLAPGAIGANALTAGRDIRATSTANSIVVPTTSAGRDIVTTAAGDVRLTTATASQDIKATAGNDVVITSGIATRDIAVDASRHSRSGALSAGGAASVLARNGDATGLAGTSTGTSDTSVGRADISAGSALAVTAAGLVQLGTAQAGTGLTITAGDATRNGAIDVTSAKTTAGIGLLDARATSSADTARDGDILVGEAAAGGNLTLTNVARGGTVGDIVVGTSAGSGAALLLDGAHDVTLPLGTATGAGTVRAVRNAGATSLTTGGTATLTAGGTASSTLLKSTGANIVVDGGTVSLDTVDANTSLAATARAGDLSLVTGTAGTTAALSTVAPGTGNVIVSTSLTSGQGSTITSVANARLANVKATTGDVKVTATSGEVTGIGAGAANIEATAGAVQIDAGNLARLGTLTAGTTLAVTGTGAIGIGTGQAGTGLTVTAGTPTSNGAIDATTLKTTAGNLLLDARATSTADATRDGHIVVGDVGAGGNVTLTNVARGGTTGDISVGNRADAGGALLLDSARDATLPLGTAGGAGTVKAVRNATATSLTSGGTATLSAGGTATSTLLKSTGANVAVDGATVSLGTADANTSLAATARTGDLTLATGIAGTTAALTTATGGTGDVIVTTRLTSGQAATISSVSDARLASVKATTGDVKVTSAAETTGVGTGAANLEATAGAVQIDAGTIALLGTIKAGTALTATAKGDLTLASGAAGTTATLSTTANAGDVIVTSLTSGQAATISSVSDARLASVKATTGDVKVTSAAETTGIGTGAANLEATAGAVILDAGSFARYGTVTAGTALTATAKGDLTLATGAAGTTATLSTTANAGDVIVSNSLTSGQAATITSVSDARLATVKATTGGLKVTATAGEVTGIGTGAANLEATAGALQVDGGAVVRLGTLKSGTTMAVTGDTVTTGTLTSGGTTSLTAKAGALTVAGGSSAGDVTLSTTGLATLGALTATGRKVTLTAADAAINGAIAAQRIEVLNKSANNALRLGDNASGSGGFELTTAEVNRLNAPEILLDAGTATGATAQDVAIGALALDTDSGSSKLDIFGTKRFDLTGAFTATGSATTRTIRFGGSASDTARASVIRVAATESAGGRIDVGDATLELRGAKIGVGQDQGFLSSIGLTADKTPIDTNTVAGQYVGNANSSLYNSGLGGRPYTLVNGLGPSLVTARSMTVRFTDYALFQNTAITGRNAGVVLGGTVAQPVTPALRLIGPNPPDAGAAALFGSVNGTIETATALLGPTVIDVIAVNRANSRINGCVIGSGGGGCIANLISQPILGVFDASKADVFKTATDFELPFDPVVGTNNESLFGDVGTYGLGDIPLDAPPCLPDDQTCIQAKKDQK